MITDTRIEALLALDREAVLYLMREAYYNGEVAQHVALHFRHHGTLYQQLLSEALLSDWEQEYVDQEMLIWSKYALGNEVQP